ncbi:MAG: alpha/beta hydrolase [Candidatus Njordarchaeia archaeon]
MKTSLNMEFLKRKGVILSIVLIVLILIMTISARAAIYSGVTTKDIYLKAMDGAKIHAVIYKKSGATGQMPAVLVVHGFSESQSTLSAINTELARHGILVMAIDYRGHGDSEGGLNYIGDPILSPNLTNDLIVAYQHLISRSDVDPARVGLIGHSMGARAVLAFACFNPAIVSAVMLGPYYIWESSLVNTTNPKNLLIIVGENDIITPPSLGRELLARGTGYMGQVGVTFGSFNNGTARKLVIVKGADHYTIISNKNVLQEILNWEYNSFNLSGTPKVTVDPSMAATGVFVTYLMIVLFFPIIYYMVEYLKERFPPAEEVKTDYKWYLKVALIVIGAIIYIYVAYFFFPLVVEIGWKNYQLFIMSGAQYTIYYLYYLVLPMMVFLAIVGAAFLILKKGTLENVVNFFKNSFVGGLILGVILSVTIFVTYFILMNLGFTGLYGDYLPTIPRWGVFLFFLAILYPLLLVDEFFMRYVVQVNIPVNRKSVRMAITMVIEWFIRVYPLMMWFMLAMNHATLVHVIMGYYNSGLISDVTTVVAFIPMNSYALYYSFSSMEMIHATSATYIFEETRNILSSTLVRALTLAFSMAAVMPFL